MALALVSCVGFAASVTCVIIALLIGLYSEVPFFAVSAAVFLAIWLVTLWRAVR